MTVSYPLVRPAQTEVRHNVTGPTLGSVTGTPLEMPATAVADAGAEVRIGRSGSVGGLCMVVPGRHG
ncbi:hypothetical protein FRAAL1274 [Frankia alni ACN14a]|uniref:Uncharacterized protein n=1 Tax=Frankia alni (strain DSM 45986 / CECT 9034 / ACN14a) TaxID=326424 RepID=Q0RR86_FRAAA|nr:hypothetical protein FRAAL1274 [Frankia alni ACN14a]